VFFDPLKPFGGTQQPGQEMTPEQRQALVSAMLGIGSAEETEDMALADLQAAQGSMGGPASGYGALGGVGQGLHSAAKSIAGGLGARAAREDVAKSRDGRALHQAALARAFANQGTPEDMSDPLRYLKPY